MFAHTIQSYDKARETLRDQSLGCYQDMNDGPLSLNRMSHSQYLNITSILDIVIRTECLRDEKKISY